VIAVLNYDIYPKIDLDTYRKEARLKGGLKVLLRPMEKDDGEALYEFFKAVPDDEARYLRDDVKSRLVIEKWAKNLDYSKTLPILALKNGAIIADATINRRRSGWKWHLGTIRIFVHNDYRNIGLGELMIDELARIAYMLEIEKLIVEVPDTSTAAINMLIKAGFHRAAVLPNMVKDRLNQPVDLVVLMKDIKPPLDESYDYEF
jgi:ribosomal protein S18 acetylase RimI-like enzyme